MKKADAMRSFVYWGNQIYSPLGKVNKHAEKMRSCWAKAIDSDYYKKLPSDGVESDKMVEKKYRGR